MIYVIDASALVSVPLKVADSNAVFLELTNLLSKGRLCFCNEVVDELARLAKGEQPLVWASGCASNRTYKGAGYPSIGYVTYSYGDLVDTTARDTQEPAAVHVVAQALELQRCDLEVAVVTEDARPKPTRACLREACDHFGLRCLSLDEFLEEAGIAADAHEDDDYDFDDDE